MAQYVELSCSFCEKRQAEVRKLVSGPLVYICDACVSACRTEPPVRLRDLCCSFCGKSAGEVAKLVAGRTHFICDECLELCDAILAEGEVPRK